MDSEEDNGQVGDKSSRTVISGTESQLSEKITVTKESLLSEKITVSQESLLSEKITVSQESLLSKKITVTQADPRWTSSHKQVFIVLVATLLILIGVGYFIFLESHHETKELSMGLKMQLLMNLSADPCQDFYNYACGGWHALKSVKNSDEVITRMDSIKENYNQRVLALLEKPLSQDDPIFKYQVKKFFAACKNKDRRNARGNDPFFQFLAKIGKFPLLDPNWQNQDFNFQDLMTKLTLLGLYPVFTFRIDGIRTVRIRLLSPFKRITEKRLRSKGYVAWIEQVLRLLGNRSPRDELYDEIELMLQVDRRIYRIQETTEIQSGDMTIEELQQRYSWLNWLKFTNDIARVTHPELPGLTLEAEVFVDDILYLDHFYHSIFIRFSNRTLANFMLYKLLPFTEALDGKYPVSPCGFDRLIPQKELPKDLIQRCLFETTEIFPDHVHRMYVDKFHRAEYDFFIKDMIYDLKEEFAKLFKYFASEFEFGQNSVEFLTQRVGYPDFLEDDQYLKSVLIAVPADDYFEFYVERARYLFSKRVYLEEKAEETEFERSLWDEALPTSEMNLAYFYEENEIYFPTVLFQDPFYNSEWPSSMKYGTLGTLTAYALFRILSGAIPRSDEEWSHIQNCFQDIANQFQIEGRTVEGSDNYLIWQCVALYHGVELSLKAYRHFVRIEGEGEPRIPGLNLNHEQLFFLSFAQMFCEQIPRHRIDDYLSSRPNYPNKIRLLTALQDIDLFSAVYGCPEGSRMNEHYNWDCRVVPSYD